MCLLFRPDISVEFHGVLKLGLSKTELASRPLPGARSADSSALRPGCPSILPAPSVWAVAPESPVRIHPALLQRPPRLRLPSAPPRLLLPGPAYPGHRARGPRDFGEPENMFSFSLKPEHNRERDHHESVATHPAWMTPVCTPDAGVKYLNCYSTRKGPVKAAATLRPAI